MPIRSLIRLGQPDTEGQCRAEGCRTSLPLLPHKLLPATALPEASHQGNALALHPRRIVPAYNPCSSAQVNFSHRPCQHQNGWRPGAPQTSSSMISTPCRRGANHAVEIARQIGRQIDQVKMRFRQLQAEQAGPAAAGPATRRRDLGQAQESHAGPRIQGEQRRALCARATQARTKGAGAGDRDPRQSRAQPSDDGTSAKLAEPTGTTADYSMQGVLRATSAATSIPRGKVP